MLAEGDGDCNIYFHSFLAGSGSSFRTDPREVYISRSGDEQVRWQSIWLYSSFFLGVSAEDGGGDDHDAERTVTIEEMVFLRLGDELPPLSMHKQPHPLPDHE